MPIYKYKCEKCGSQVEVIQKINDAPLKRCAKCRGKLEKVVSRTSFQLKGSGWYATDYPRKEAPTGKDKGSDTKGSDSKGSDSKGSDSKGSDSKGSDSKGSDKKGSDKKSEIVSTTTASRDKD
jgi:putative FmdB family regulatory protein